jgi:dCMP deaminase
MLTVYKPNEFVREVERLLRIEEKVWEATSNPTAKDKAWMDICYYSAAKLSTCGKRQYCSVILAADGSVAGMGYNGAPPGMQHCIDGGCPRFQEGSVPGSNYDNCVSIHAEENAIIRSSPERRAGGTLLVNGTPCFGCAKKICNSGVARAVVVDDPSYPMGSESYKFIYKAGIDVVLLDPSLFKELT